MRRFTGFGARRSLDKAAATNPVKKSIASTSPQCFPQFYSPARDYHRRRSVDGRVSDHHVGESAAAREAAAAATTVVAMRRRSVDGRVVTDNIVGDRDLNKSTMRRRSVDDSQPGESLDLQAVRQHTWKTPNSPRMTLSSNSWADISFSSSSDVCQSSSRPSNASTISSCTSVRDTNRDTNGAIGDPVRGVVVVGFDANVKEGSVGATVSWALRNLVIQKGDMIVLVGVMDSIRGPLGYKVQVNDQTWLGANKKFLAAEIKAKTLVWSGQFPVLKKRCADAGVTLLVDVKAAPRPEVAIVHEATARGAVHVVLDKSLRNKRRRYYSERLACAVTRMRRSGGVDSIRAAVRHTSSTVQYDNPDGRESPAPNSFSSNLSNVQYDNPAGREIAPNSFSSNLSNNVQHDNPGRETTPNSFSSNLSNVQFDNPGRETPKLEKSVNSVNGETAPNSFSSNLARLVKLVDEKNSTGSTTRRHSTSPMTPPTIDEAEELFCIDHNFLARRVEMLLEPEIHDLAEHHRRHDQLIVMDDDDDGYESDDLFSLAGDGASRRPSVVAAFFGMESARNSMAARSSLSGVVTGQLATG